MQKQMKKVKNLKILQGYKNLWICGMGHNILPVYNIIIYEIN